MQFNIPMRNWPTLYTPERTSRVLITSQIRRSQRLCTHQTNTSTTSTREGGTEQHHSFSDWPVLTARRSIKWITLILKASQNSFQVIISRFNDAVPLADCLRTGGGQTASPLTREARSGVLLGLLRGTRQ